MVELNTTAEDRWPQGTGRPAQPATWITRVSIDEISARRRAGDPQAPLAGIEFAIKDNIDLAGVPTTAACPALGDRAAPTSAVAVQRLVDAGATAVGKTNMDQFATGLVGTRSPYGACHAVDSVAHVSGGSSSGSAIAVATGEVPLALGTDTAGSGRVPAAFNALVGVKPTRGLISTRGLLPACPSLDCVTTLTRTVAEARAALDALVWPDPDDPWSRPRPPRPPVPVASHMRVVAVPAEPLDLDPVHAHAWQVALDRLHRAAARVVPVDVAPFLRAARLLYEGPWLAQRWASFGAHLAAGDADLDPVVKAVVTPGSRITGAQVYTGLDRLARLRRATEPTWLDVDALMLPVTPTHPTLAEVAANPVGVNTRLGSYTNFVNLLDLCAVAVPAGRRDDGLPFGVQFIAPAFADDPLLDLAARWCGEPGASAADSPTGSGPGSGTGRTLLAVCGAHLSGLALNPQLLALGAHLAFRARTAPGYRLVRLPGTGVPRPGLIRSGDGPVGGIAVEVWRLPHQGVGALTELIPAPLTLGRVELDDGRDVLGFLGDVRGTDGATDISAFGGWRAYQNAQAGQPPD